MKIVHSFPPNEAAIRRVFRLTGGEIFAYGDTIYNPGGEKLPAALIAHEEVHERQQGSDVESWWERYLESPRFRLRMELEAHRVEYRVMLELATSRNHRRLCLSHVAKKLAAPLYGRLVKFEDAKKMIKEDINA